MLLYYLFWMFMGFIMHFYIIFGTNLLTRGPMQIAVFFAYFSVSQKRNTKRVQTEWNLRERDFWNKRDPEDLEWTSRNNRGGHEAGRRACPPGHAPTLVGPSWLHRPTSFAYIYSYTLETSREPQNHFSTAATFYTHDIPSRDLFRWSAGGGFDHGGLLHQHHSLSDGVWVVYHRPSGP